MRLDSPGFSLLNGLGSLPKRRVYESLESEHECAWRMQRPLQMTLESDCIRFSLNKPTKCDDPSEATFKVSLPRCLCDQLELVNVLPVRADRYGFAMIGSCIQSRKRNCYINVANPNRERHDCMLDDVSRILCLPKRRPAFLVDRGEVTNLSDF